jgi:hypothetical protein
VKGGVEHTHLTTDDITRTYLNIGKSTNINQDYKMIYGWSRVTNTHHTFLYLWNNLKLDFNPLKFNTLASSRG